MCNSNMVYFSTICPNTIFLSNSNILVICQNSLIICRLKNQVQQDLWPLQYFLQPLGVIILYKRQFWQQLQHDSAVVPILLGGLLHIFAVVI